MQPLDDARAKQVRPAQGSTAPPAPPGVRKPPDPADVVTGARIRARLVLLGVSQEKLGEACGVSFQQVQKYEKGINRVGASRLVQIAGVLGCAPAELLPVHTGGNDPLAGAAGFAAVDVALVQAFGRLSPRAKAALLTFVRALPGEPGCAA